MSYLRVGQNVEMKVGRKYRERPMIKKKDVFIIMISCGLTYIGVMSVCMQEINERVVTKSTKKTFEPDKYLASLSSNYLLNCSMYIFSDFFLCT